MRGNHRLRALGFLLSTALLIGGLASPTVVLANGPCHLAVNYAQPLTVQVTWLSSFEARILPSADVWNPPAAAGCTIRVCHVQGGVTGAGGCANSVVAANEDIYEGYAAYLNCRNNGGDGWFRSYVRYTHDALTTWVIGPARYVCT